MSLQKEFQTCGFISYETLPAYTLQDILNKLPESIQIYDLYIFKKVGLWWLKSVDVTNNGTVHLEKMPRLIDAAYYMLRWCIQKGFVKTNKEVKDEEKKIDWEQRRYELAKAAMQGFCSNSQKQFINVDSSIIAKLSICFADALIKKLKGE